MGKTANTIKEKTDVILINSNKVGHKLFAKKIKHMFVLRQHNAG
jgi:hypothetical protein